MRILSTEVAHVDGRLLCEMEDKTLLDLPLSGRPSRFDLQQFQGETAYVIRYLAEVWNYKQRQVKSLMGFPIRP